MEELNHGVNDIVISNPAKEQNTLEQCILNIVKKEGYIIYDVTKKELSKDGGNYLGTLYEVDVKGKTKEGQKTTSIFIKTIPSNHADIAWINLQNVYKREKFVYDELSKIFDKMQNEASISEENRYKMVKSLDETHPQAVVLENIAKKGFKTWFRMDMITLNYAEECIKEIAKFHALSFALEIKHANYFNNFIKPLKTQNKRGESHEKLCDFIIASQLNILDSCDKYRLGGQLRHLLGKYLEYVTKEDSICCLCHADYRPDNIMYKTVNGRVTEVVPVDYQFTFYGCPVLDIIYFIYSSTDHQFREDHQQYLKDLYHETLTKFLNYFSISVDSVFSKVQFEELYKKKQEYGLIITLLIGPFVFTDKEKAMQLKDVIDESKVVIDDRYKVRLYDALKEFYVI